MIERLALLWKQFSPLEERLLAEVRSVLPAAARPSFDAQVAGIKRVCRSPPSWSEICLYRRKRAGSSESDAPSFPCTDEFRLAEVRFRAEGRRFKSTLTCIGGYIFDFATTPGPKRVAFVAWDSEPRVTLLGDPLRAPSGQKSLESLPTAWTEVLQSGIGESATGWELHDEATAHRVALDDGEYLVLAEREGDEFLLHRLEPPADSLFHVANHDGIPEPVVGDVATLFRQDRRGGS